jgi:hypothetical protein
LSAAAAAFLAGCGYSPDDVCDHVLKLAANSPNAEAAKAALGSREDCIKTETRRKEMQGMVKYKENNKCAMEADTLEELQNCK